jgi:5-methylcytosine-specific restriction endonuclease McrA
MPTSREALALIDSLKSSLGIEWLNKGRVSDDWKAKIFVHPQTDLQFAIYDRQSIVVLLEREIPGIPGVTLRPRRPRGSSLEITTSHFRNTPGFCYDVDDLQSLKQLLLAYLQPVSESAPALEDLLSEFERQVSSAASDSPEQRRERLRSASRTPRTIRVQTTVFIRNPDVVAEVLYRAAGRCELCEQPAPFRKATDGKPYLEVHHRIPLAKGGEDSVDNAVAVCPNCHRKGHYG